MSEHPYNRGEGWSSVGISGKGIPGRGNSQCKASEVEVSLICSRKSEARVAGAKQVRRELREVRNPQRGGAAYVGPRRPLENFVLPPLCEMESHEGFGGVRQAECCFKRRTLAAERRITIEQVWSR